MVDETKVKSYITAMKNFLDASLPSTEKYNIDYTVIGRDGKTSNMRLMVSIIDKPEEQEVKMPPPDEDEED